MSDINKEIDELSKDLEKSNNNPRDLIKSKIFSMKKEDVKEFVKSLTDPQELEIIKDVLEKALSMDDEYSPKRTYTEAEDMRQESLTGSDDEDEDLVKPEAAEHPHQGTKTDGWEGQVIKGEKSYKACEMHKAYDKSCKACADLNGEQLEKKQGVPEGVDPAKHERCVQDLKDQGKDKESAIRICNDSLRGQIKKSEEDETDLEKGGPGSGKKRFPQSKTEDAGMGAYDRARKQGNQAYHFIGNNNSPRSGYVHDDHFHYTEGGKNKKVHMQHGQDYESHPSMQKSEEKEEVTLEKASSKGECGTKEHKQHHKELQELLEYEKKEHKEEKQEKKMEKGMSVKEAVDKILKDKWQVQDVLPKVEESKRDDVLSKLREMEKNMKKSLIEEVTDFVNETGIDRESLTKGLNEYNWDFEAFKKSYKREQFMKSLDAEKMIQVWENLEKSGYSNEDIQQALSYYGYSNEVIEKADSLIQTRKASEKNISMKDGKLPEQDQVKFKPQDDSKPEDEEEQENPENLKQESPKTADQATEEAPKMKKSFDWSHKTTLDTNHLGRNFNFNVAEELEKQSNYREEVLKSRGFENPNEEKLAKSEDKELDISKMIQKSMDKSASQIATEEKLAKQKAGAEVKKSFSDEDLFRALYLDNKKAKELLGE